MDDQIPPNPDWIAELKRGNDLTAELIRIQKNWRYPIRNGILAGLGSVLGATLVVSLLIWIMQPLKHIQFLQPTLEKIGQELEKRPTKAR